MARQRRGDYWGGRAAQKARAHMATLLPAPCGQCGVMIDPTDPWVVGHIKDRATHPELTWDPTNWRHEHRSCSDRTGQSVVIAKARADLARELGTPAYAAEIATDQPALFPTGSPAPTAPPRPFPLFPTGTHSGSIEPRDDLRWDPDYLAGFPWLQGFSTVPEDAAPPLYMSPVHPAAVCSYGWDGCTHNADKPAAVAWIESELRLTLRWWQRLAIVRQLEHRADGSLCYREVDESCPRRAGKSVRLRGCALWRMDNAELFGEVQTVVHTGSDLAICREIQRGAWSWAERRGWTVGRANGKEALETSSEDRWLVRAQDAVYGYDVCYGLVDEGWDVRPDTVSEGLEPAMLERHSPQLHITSTAHRRATSMMRTRIANALTIDNPEVLVLIWAAPDGADPADPEVWRAASPHWSEDRRRMIASKYAQALAGEADAHADDLDPLEAFRAQYLNMWRLRAAKAGRGDPVITAEDWAARAVDTPAGVPVSAALESWFSRGVSVALGYRYAGDAITVVVTDHPDLASAVREIRRSGYRGTVTVGSSLATDPALAGVKVRKGEGQVRAAVQEITRLARSGAIRHDGGEHLAEQLLSVRTLPGADGPRMASTGRADAIKAAVWAATSARRPSVGRPRVILPRATVAA
jgi:hypothetical protein